MQSLSVLGYLPILQDDRSRRLVQGSPHRRLLLLLNTLFSHSEGLDLGI